jgi:hypothetical protein
MYARNHHFIYKSRNLQNGDVTSEVLRDLRSGVYVRPKFPINGFPHDGASINLLPECQINAPDHVKLNQMW